MQKRKKLIVVGVLVLCCAAVIAAALLLRSGREQPLPHAPPQIAYPNGAEEPLPRLAEDLIPADVVAGLLRAVRDWDLASASRWATSLQDTIFSDEYRGVLVPLITRIEFNARAQRILGDTAIVDVSVYAVDLRSALGDLRENAANYLLHRQLENTEPNWAEFLSEHISRLEDTDSLMRVMRTAPAYLLMDSQGNWVFDAQSPDNAAFYNAVSGGLPELIEFLSEVEAAAAE